MCLNIRDLEFLQDHYYSLLVYCCVLICIKKISCFINWNNCSKNENKCGGTTNDKWSSKGCGPYHMFTVWCPCLCPLSVLCMPPLVCLSVRPPTRPSLPPSGESPCPLVLVQGSGFLWSVKTIVIVTNTSFEFVPKCISPGGLSVNRSVFASPVNMSLLRNW